MKELARITQLELMEYPYTLEFFMIGKNVISNPNAVRCDDPITGDIIFIERSSNETKRENKRNN